ncbi:FAD-dependent oxidoreductase [Marinivivus vitaminiproducens]|uniref:FAD-dependent oxidoreductase n=1 Tax=Marinivivus vitaminiproducens TaxID=3035935 RepID=UPI00279B01B8|nr:FAD-dependent oxidoreductase [Geminicoccaceae bacterium SCSIO 64248]
MSASGERLFEPARTVPLFGRYEVVVLGGGPAGIAAAAAAASAGCSTCLVERYGFLGGMGTAAGVTNFCGLYANVFGDIRKVVTGVADAVLDRIDRLGGLNAPHVVLGRTKAQAYDTAAYKCAADDLLQSAGAEILFHALAAGAIMDDDEPSRIRALLVETKSGRQALAAEIFIDASGDGDLAAWAGAAYTVGDGAGNMMYPTTMFRLNGVDPDRAGDAWRTIPERMADAERAGRRRFPRQGAIVRPQKHSSEWRINVTQLRGADGRAISGIDARAFSAGEIQGRAQALAFLDFLRDEVPGFADAYVIDIAPQIGIRETRRVAGRYELTASDVLSCADFTDSIGLNGWPLEKHVAGTVEWVWPPIPDSRGYNQLPYRMLLPPGIANLLVAGRCAAMDHEAQSAARVSGACFVMGQAAGTAAHLARRQGVDPADVDIGALQRALEHQGAMLG